MKVILDRKVLQVLELLGVEPEDVLNQPDSSRRLDELIDLLNPEPPEILRDTRAAYNEGFDAGLRSVKSFIIDRLEEGRI